LDFVNNVENVFVRPPLGSNYTINVIGRRVNVNAVTPNTNDVVQDYALVVSSGNGELTNPIVSLTRTNDSFTARGELIGLTNGVALLKGRVGIERSYSRGGKSEGQRGAEFGVVGLSTDTPFDEPDPFGKRILHGMAPSMEIPDGSPEAPGAALMFAVGAQPEPIARVIV